LDKLKDIIVKKKFQKKIEYFVCEHCGMEVQGNGYTNHCPKCLWSKHVDNFPGDRENECKGGMEPIHAYFKKGKWRIIHHCQKCKQKTEVYASEADDLDQIIKLSTAAIKK